MRKRSLLASLPCVSSHCLCPTCRSSYIQICLSVIAPIYRTKDDHFSLIIPIENLSTNKIPGHSDCDICFSLRHRLTHQRHDYCDSFIAETFLVEMSDIDNTNVCTREMYRPIILKEFGPIPQSKKASDQMLYEQICE